MTTVSLISLLFDESSDEAPIHYYFKLTTSLLCGVSLIWWAILNRGDQSGDNDETGSKLSVETEEETIDDDDSDINDSVDEDNAIATGAHSVDTKGSSDSSLKDNNDAIINNKCPTREKAREQGLVLYNKHWYDVTKFIPHHPGGAEILQQYLGTDITHVFHVMHRNPMKIMKYRKPVREATVQEVTELTQRRNNVCQDMFDDYTGGIMTEGHANELLHKDKFNLEAFERDCHELYDQFMKAGYTKPTLFWLIQKTALVLSFLFLSVLCMRVSALSTSEENEYEYGQLLLSMISTTPLSYILPGIFLGLFWHQSGFLMHDAEHHNLIGNERVNDILGWLYGTVFLGVNGAWWREEHREHHAMLNSFDEDGFKDPQVRLL